MIPVTSSYTNCETCTFKYIFKCVKWLDIHMILDITIF